MRYYGVKYALSSGQISEFDGHKSGDPDYVYDRGILFSPRWYLIGRDAFTNRDDAVKAAIAKRDKKIESLRAQIAKLEAMDFSA